MNELEQLRLKLEAQVAVIDASIAANQLTIGVILPLIILTSFTKRLSEPARAVVLMFLFMAMVVLNAAPFLVT